MQWPVVSALVQEAKKHHNEKDGSKETPKLEVTDKSHSWVRISHDLNKLVTDLSNKEDDNNEQETSEMQFEDYALKTNVLAFASRSKSKSTETYFCQLIHKNYTYWGKNLDRYWTTRIFAHRLFSVKEIDQSSSSW